MNCDLTLPQPLARLVEACAAYCQVDCCGLDAFDVNAYSIRWWVREAGAEKAAEALGQLTALICQLDGVDHTVVSKGDFCHEWHTGSDCAAYLRTWRTELERGIVLASKERSPVQRLVEARQHGGREYPAEVQRLGWDGGRLLRAGETQRALDVFAAIAALDPDDASIANDVEFARKVLAAHKGSPNACT